MKTAMKELKEEVFQLLDGVTLKSQMDNILLNTLFDEAVKEEKEQQLDLIRFLRTNDKMGKSVEDLYNEYLNK